MRVEEERLSVQEERLSECTDICSNKAKKGPKKAKILPFTRVPVERQVEKVREWRGGQGCVGVKGAPVARDLLNVGALQEPKKKARED